MLKMIQKHRSTMSWIRELLGGPGRNKAVGLGVGHTLKVTFWLGGMLPSPTALYYRGSTWLRSNLCRYCVPESEILTQNSGIYWGALCYAVCSESRHPNPSYGALGKVLQSLPDLFLSLSSNRQDQHIF